MKRCIKMFPTRENLVRYSNDFLRVSSDEGLFEAIRKSVYAIKRMMSDVNLVDRSHQASETVGVQEGSFNPYDHLCLLKPIEIEVVNKEYTSLEDVKFSLITTIKNEESNIIPFLQSIQEQTLTPEEVLIVDGGSTDSTIPIIEDTIKNYPSITLIDGGKVNIAQGRNIAIRESKNELIVLADAGCLLDKNYCMNLIGCFNDNKDADLVGGIYFPMKSSDYCKDMWNWEDNDWFSFLPSARSLAVKRSLALQAGLFPEYLTLTGEDTLFDIGYRRITNKWVFNKKAFVFWKAPDSKESVDKLMHSYMKGDGESGIGDFKFYSFLSDQRKQDSDDLPLWAQGFSGFMEGRSRRSEIEVTKRGISGVFVILSGVPLTDSGGGQRGAQLAFELVRKNYKVIFVNVYPSYEEQKKFYFDIDYSLLELYSFSDFSVQEFAERYEAILDRMVVMLEFPIPDFIPIIDYLKSFGKKVKVIYDYIDNWNSSLGGEWYSHDKELEVINKSDVLIASAKALQKSLEIMSGRTVTLVPNAVNLCLFNRTINHLTPDDLPIQKPLVVYVGAMWGEWFDWDLIEYAARKLTSFNFVLIGNVAEWRINYFKDQENVFFLGLKRQTELPAYLQGANICIIPFKADNITLFVNPLKVYEYLAMGKPVVSTDMAELHEVPGVAIAKSYEEFVHHIDNLINSPFTTDTNDFLRCNNWQYRLRTIERLVSFGGGS